MGDWMLTHAGKHVDPLNVRPEDICLEDIAFALSNISRFGGHVPFLSVAEHSVRVCMAAPPKLKKAALLHDAAEAYIGDIIWPLKRSIAIWDKDNAVMGNPFEKCDHPMIRDIEMGIMWKVGVRLGFAFVEWGKMMEPVTELDYLDCLAAGIDAWGVDAIFEWHRGPELALQAQQWLLREPIQHHNPLMARHAFKCLADELGIK